MNRRKALLAGTSLLATTLVPAKQIAKPDTLMHAYATR